MSHKGPIIGGGWTAEECAACGNYIWDTDICERGISEKLAAAQAAKDAAKKVWMGRAEREFEAYWKQFGGI